MRSRNKTFCDVEQQCPVSTLLLNTFTSLSNEEAVDVSGLLLICADVELQKQNKIRLLTVPSSVRIVQYLYYCGCSLQLVPSEAFLDWVTHVCPGDIVSSVWSVSHHRAQCRLWVSFQPTETHLALMSELVDISRFTCDPCCTLATGNWWLVMCTCARSTKMHIFTIHYLKWL